MKVGDVVRHNASDILFGHPHLHFKNMVGIIVKVYKPQEMQKPSVDEDSSVGVSFNKIGSLGDFRSLPSHAWSAIHSSFLNSQDIAESISDLQCDQESEQSVVNADGSSEIVEKAISKMFQLCLEEHALGSWSRMSQESRNRVLQIRGDLWDGFESICAVRCIKPTPESLSSAAGGLPCMFSDNLPDLEQFHELVW